MSRKNLQHANVFVFTCAFFATMRPFLHGNELIQVHLVPHSHDDTGWINTFEEYFDSKVKLILDSSVEELQLNKSRTFVFSEMAFFEKWFVKQDNATKLLVKSLLNSKQLEFVNGGWCSSDEATTLYTDIIDQMTLGLQFIESNFGKEARPTIAWQIDCFGHSAEFASLASLMSFDGLFFARIDGDDKKKRIEERRLEMIWRGSSNYKQLSQIFTGVFYDHYMPPKRFCFDEFEGCNDMFSYSDVEAFEEEVFKEALSFPTNNLMITMGADFSYVNSNKWYSNMDKLIGAVNSRGKINAFYSTPSRYLKEVRKKNISLEVKTDDFFPYSDKSSGCYWTGFYTSRPSLKGYIRESSNILQACKQLESNSKDYSHSSSALKRAMAINQHHDAVTGTEKQYVADDYVRQLFEGRVNCQNFISKSVSTKMNFKKTGNFENLFQRCDYLNVSACNLVSSNKTFIINIYNPVAREVKVFIKFPTNYGESLVVSGAKKTELAVDLFPVSKITLKLQKLLQENPTRHEVVFPAVLPPLGFRNYLVSHQVLRKAKSNKAFFAKSSQDSFIENDHLRLEFSSQQGNLLKLSRKNMKLSVDFDQKFLYYKPEFMGDDKCVNSAGAYIFRSGSSEFIPNDKSVEIKTEVFKSRYVEEVRQVINSFISRVIRLYKNTEYIEFEHTIGPLPNDRISRDVISRIKTNIKSKDLFYTDGNGREIKKRKRNFRETWTLINYDKVSSNYYPVSTRIFINDSTAHLVIMTDRAQGGTSMAEGEIDLMLHRRIFSDDQLGVEEELNELGPDGEGLVTRGKHRMMLTTKEEFANLHRKQEEIFQLQPIVSFAESKQEIIETLDTNHSYSLLRHGLPENIHLLTLERLSKSSLLIRLENMYEHAENSSVTRVKFDDLFDEFKIKKLTETNLSANQKLKDKTTLKWRTNNEPFEFDKREKSDLATNKEYLIFIKPMEIRTFIAEVTYV